MSGVIGPKTRTGSGVRAAAVDVMLNVALPYAGYLLLRTATTEPTALVLSAILPAAVAAISVIVRRRINALSLLVIAATALSLAAVAWSGSAWFALIRPSFITGSLALAFAVSLVARRPILFYLARDTTCPDVESARAFEGRWTSPAFRRGIRILTLIWALFLGGEALLRVGIAVIWPDPAVIAATHVLWILLPILLVRWSIQNGKRWRDQR